jgi:hypothetical protein
MTRRAALVALGAGGAAAALGTLGYLLRVVGSSGPGMPPADGGGGGMMGMMGNVGPADMSLYMEMFMRHSEISRVVEEIPGGVRTTTQSDSADLAAQLKSHVSSMYSHLDQNAEVTCMSRTLPTLFRNASGYRRTLTFTPTGVIAEETADDPALTETIRAHAREVTGFVNEGMRAMMQGMMGGGMMGPGCMMGPGQTSPTTTAPSTPRP